MNSTNINDPVAVKALLDQLRASRLWRDTLNASPSHISSEQHPEIRESPSSSTLEVVQGESKAQSSDAAPPASVAALLSQLRTSPWTPIAVDTPPLSNLPTTRPLSQNTPRPKLQDPQPTQSEHRSPWPIASTPAKDIRSLSFQQALPHLTQLAGDPEFLAAVSRLRQEQNELEQQLWEERQAILKKHEEKVKVARTKATLIGAGLSKHEADMMNDAYRRDIQRFDKERALLAWDALIQKQQATLESLGVPAMFATSSEANCQACSAVTEATKGGPSSGGVVRRTK